MTVFTILNAIAIAHTFRVFAVRSFRIAHISSANVFAPGPSHRGGVAILAAPTFDHRWRLGFGGRHQHQQRGEQNQSQEHFRHHVEVCGWELGKEQMLVWTWTHVSDHHKDVSVCGVYIPQDGH